ncbi:hypothetical protein Tco_0835393 [Tanacetum coccineum]
MVEYSKKWHNGTSRVKSTETSDVLAAIQAQLNNLGREIKKANEKVYAAQVGYAAIRNQGASIKTLEIQIGQMSKERRNHMDHNSRKLTLKLRISIILYPEKKKIQGVSLCVALLIIYALDPRKTIFVYARAKIHVYESKITLRVREERIIFTSIKPASSVIKRVYMLSLRERMELDLEARLMGETLVINRSLGPLNRDYIKLNYLNEPFELRRDQGDDLMPTIVEGEEKQISRKRNKKKAKSKQIQAWNGKDKVKIQPGGRKYNLRG